MAANCIAKDYQVFATTKDLKSSANGPRGSVVETFVALWARVNPDTGLVFIVVVVFFLGVIIAFFFI